MQINDNQKKAVGWMLRIAILGICTWVIWHAVADRWSFDFQHTDIQVGLIVLVIVLMPINWGLEVWRWKRSLDTIGHTYWKEASRQVFSGLTLNWILPFTSGDLIARLTPDADRKKVAVLILYNRGIMLLITCLFGAFGIYVFSELLFDSVFWQIGLAVVLLAVAGVVIFRLLDRDTFPIWILPITLISVIRYLIFTIQFIMQL
ncbi:MAG: hypothetical protein GY816_09535 [Cytophagales bacterium]|nr:hypothetical protein [Cytophagales bacterium]